MTYLFLRLLHLLFMAAWFGAVLFAAGDAKRTLSADGAQLPLLADRLGRAARIASGAGWLTVITGVALIFAVGGFGAVSPAIHIGLLLALVMIGVGIGLIGRNIGKIQAGIASGTDPRELLPQAKQMAMGTGIFHTLWLLTLALMVFRTALFG